MTFSDPLPKHFRLTPRQITALTKLGIANVRDLLFYFPTRYEEFVGEKSIAELRAGERAVIKCRIEKIKSQKTWKTKINIAEAIVKDASGSLRVTWFNQPYIAKIFKSGNEIKLSGRVSKNKNGPYLANPTYEISPEEKTYHLNQTSLGEKLFPVYPEVLGISSRWFDTHIKKVLETLAPQEETLPEAIIERYHLPKINRALKAIHSPKTLAEAGAARKRFSFEEIFIIQLARRRERKKLETVPSFKIEPEADLIKEFTNSLPYKLTAAQERVIIEILEDLKKPHPMTRLLEGDVGSGKTVVSAVAALAAVKSGLQVAFMAPTEILARQHFEEFMRRLGPFRVAIGFITSSSVEKFPSKINPQKAARVSKNQLLKWMGGGDIKILIGTHSLIENLVKFKKLGFVVVDEQHRFGTHQRAALLRNKELGIRNYVNDKKSLIHNSSFIIPHFLSMSATPIPRTLALTMYGDLDISVIDEMPPGRKPVETKIVPPHEREKIYSFIRDELRNDAQAFVVCPRIEHNEKKQTSYYVKRWNWDEVRSVKKEHKKLSEEIFPDLAVGMVHGKLTPKEKAEVMHNFRSGKLNILVSTSVVEVGVDIPNASIMVIEGGERFGLATLHQFRGRVGRKGQKAYCFVFTTDQDATGLRRLKALESSKSGFELAEYDLQFRGPGELAGKKQWGFSDIGMEALKNLKMVEAARKEAEAIVTEDIELKKYPLLKERVEKIKTLHFE